MFSLWTTFTILLKKVYLQSLRCDGSRRRHQMRRLVLNHKYVGHPNQDVCPSHHHTNGNLLFIWCKWIILKLTIAKTIHIILIFWYSCLQHTGFIVKKKKKSRNELHAFRCIWYMAIAPYLVYKLALDEWCIIAPSAFTYHFRLGQHARPRSIFF